MTIACRRSGAPTPVSYPKERWEPVRLESAAFEREFDLLVLSGQDRGWTYELFSPSLIAWLTDRAPADLAFELNEGWLCVMQPGEPGDPDAIEALCGAAAHLAGRLREEGKEVVTFISGRKGDAYYKFRSRPVELSWQGFSDQPTYDKAEEMAHALIESFLKETEAGGVDEVHCVVHDWFHVLHEPFVL